MKHCLYLLIIFFLFYSSFVGAQSPAVLRDRPENCGPIVYYDIDLSGNLIEVDYVRATERIVRNFTFDGELMPQALGGFCDVAGEYVCLYVKKPPSSISTRFDRWLAWFSLWDRSGASTTQTNILFNYAGDWAIVPVDQRKVYVWNSELQDRRNTKLVFDPSINKVVGEFDFELRGTSLVGRSRGGDYL